MARQQRSQKTRDDIVVEAARLINERTWDHASMKDFTRNAGVTTGAVYFHFANKEAIALTIIDEYNKRTQRDAEEILQQHLPAMETILLTIAKFTRAILKDPIVQAGARLTSQPLVFDNPPVLPWTAWSTVHVQNLTRAIQEGDVKPEIDVDRYASYAIGTYAGVFIFSGLLNGLNDLLERVSDLSIILISSYVVPEKQAYWAQRALEICDATQPPLQLSTSGRLER
ncbi:TetR/AcrR family transcriptional regulator [Microbacterium rhizomatis]|uniref:TetR/AcrR family transcriptional regulator n=1 Tax=Microbacterium rhizomatis TaxID=1631477 RepID=UPI00147868D1|nr:TetR/AcrR family transcriptional regulator [Microbacterium rhizomatis]